MSETVGCFPGQFAAIQSVVKVDRVQEEAATSCVQREKGVFVVIPTSL